MSRSSDADPSRRESTRSHGQTSSTVSSPRWETARTDVPVDAGLATATPSTSTTYRPLYLVRVVPSSRPNAWRCGGREPSGQSTPGHQVVTTALVCRARVRAMDHGRPQQSGHRRLEVGLPRLSELSAPYCTAQIPQAHARDRALISNSGCCAEATPHPDTGSKPR